ncbi:unnamed protein product [Ixodes pacificus]
MGESALKSHMKSAKHAGIMKIAANSSVHNYLAPGTSERSTVPPPPQLPNKRCLQDARVGDKRRSVVDSEGRHIPL